MGIATEKITTEDETGGFPPFAVIDGNPARGIVLVCDHASNLLPAHYGTLGLAPGELERHIAFDPGAAAVTRSLAAELDAPAVLSTFSRLLIDPNRGEDDPTLIMRLSDGAIVPGNHPIDRHERARRLALYYSPYHAAISATIDKCVAEGRIPVLVSIHSFTPSWRGRWRPWQVGILWDADPRLAVPLIDFLSRDGTLTVGDNEPYSGVLVHDCMYRHGTRRGLAHALVELRQDLIVTEAGAAEWAGRIAAALSDLNRLPQLHEVRHYGSRSGPVERERRHESRRTG